MLGGGIIRTTAIYLDGGGVRKAIKIPGWRRSNDRKDYLVKVIQGRLKIPVVQLPQ